MSVVARSETSAIPTDWTEARIGDLGIVQTGSTPPTSNRSLYGHSFMFVSPADMGLNKYITRTQKMLSPAGFKQSRRFNRGSVLFVCIGSTIGKIGIAAEDLTSNQQINSVTPGSGVDPEYLYYAMSTISDLVKSQAGEQAVPLVNKSDFSDFTVALPGVEEQRVIAKALGDSDAMVTALERLITKKQAIKQGMMQQLLTGQTRLPGFTEPWRRVLLRDSGMTYGGLTGKSKEDFGQGLASYVTFMEVMAGPRLRGTRLESVVVGAYERQNRVARGDVLFNGSSETPEEVALAAVVDFAPAAPTYLNSFCFGFRVKRLDLVDPTYLALYFRSASGRALVSSLAQGATRYNIAKTKFVELEPELPPIDEQKAIAALHGDTEEEIEVLLGRLAKARSIKQGMMQELLTGRTRLGAGKVTA